MNLFTPRKPDEKRERERPFSSVMDGADEETLERILKFCNKMRLLPSVSAKESLGYESMAAEAEAKLKQLKDDKER